MTSRRRAVHPPTATALAVAVVVEVWFVRAITVAVTASLLSSRATRTRHLGVALECGRGGCRRECSPGRQSAAHSDTLPSPLGHLFRRELQAALILDQRRFPAAAAA
jgi:hypothetical protein